MWKTNCEHDWLRLKSDEDWVISPYFDLFRVVSFYLLSFPIMSHFMPGSYFGQLVVSCSLHFIVDSLYNVSGPLAAKPCLVFLSVSGPLAAKPCLAFYLFRALWLPNHVWFFICFGPSGRLTMFGFLSVLGPLATQTLCLGFTRHFLFGPHP